MKEKLINEIKTAMHTVITADQMSILCNVLNRTLQNIDIAEKLPDSEAQSRLILNCKRYLYQPSASRDAPRKH